MTFTPPPSECVLTTSQLQLVKIITLRSSQFELTWKSLTIFCKGSLFAGLLPLTQIPAVLSIIMLLITIVFAGILMYNFNRGLKTQREFTCGINDHAFIHSTFPISGQEVQVKGRRSSTKRHRIRASRSDAHTPQSNEHRLKAAPSSPQPYETDYVCASSTCILFMLLLVDRGRTPPALSFPCRLFLSTIPLLPKGNSFFSLSTHDSKYIDPWSQDFSPTSLALSHTTTVTDLQSAWSRFFYSHCARTRLFSSISHQF